MKKLFERNYDCIDIDFEEWLLFLIESETAFLEKSMLSIIHLHFNFLV